MALDLYNQDLAQAEIDEVERLKKIHANESAAGIPISPMSSTGVKRESIYDTDSFNFNKVSVAQDGLLVGSPQSFSSIRNTTQSPIFNIGSDVSTIDPRFLDPNNITGFDEGLDPIGQQQQFKPMSMMEMIMNLPTSTAGVNPSVQPSTDSTITEDTNLSPYENYLQSVEMVENINKASAVGQGVLGLASTIQGLTADEPEVPQMANLPSASRQRKVRLSDPSTATEAAGRAAIKKAINRSISAAKESGQDASKVALAATGQGASQELDLATRVSGTRSDVQNKQNMINAETDFRNAVTSFEVKQKQNEIDFTNEMNRARTVAEDNLRRSSQVSQGLNTLFSIAGAYGSSKSNTALAKYIAAVNEGTQQQNTRANELNSILSLIEGL